MNQLRQRNRDRWGVGRRGGSGAGVLQALRPFFFVLAFVQHPIPCLAAEAAVEAAKPIEAPAITLDELVKMEIPTVEAASKYRQKITEAPSSVTIIESDEVKRYGYRTLAEILQSAPGLYVTYDRDYSFLGVRGFNLGDYNNRVLLLIDGHRMNNSLSDAAPIGTEFLLDVDLIERVEIIRGPGSSLYGNNAFFGVINVITRKGADLTGHGAEASAEVASFDTYKGRVTYGTHLTNGLELLISGTLYNSQGQDRLYYQEFDTPANNHGVAEHADADDYKNCFGSITYLDFKLEGGYIDRAKENPTAQYLADFNDDRWRTRDQRGYVDLKYDHQFTDLFDMAARVYYDQQDLTLAEPRSGTLYQDQQSANWWGVEAQFTKLVWDRHTVTFGGEYRDDFNQEQKIVNADTGAVLNERQSDRQNYGIYLQGDIVVVTNLHLNAGCRYDQYGDLDAAFNPRLALIYAPFARTVLKAIYGTAFRAPNFYELRRVANSPYPPPDPETITSYELVYEQGIGDHLRSSVAGFYNRIDDLITFQEQRYQNLEGAEAKGVELALEAFWPFGVRGRASYSFQRTEDSATGQRLIDSPEHLGKLNLSVPLLKDKIFAGLEFLYISSRNTIQQTIYGTTEPGAPADGYAVVNLTLFSQNLVKGLDLSATVYNLFDESYGDPSTPGHRQAVIEQDGRTFRVKLAYRF